MIKDAKCGNFDLIITKEISRFARNILDSIGYTRELKAIGVGVIFLNDNINTLDNDAEMRLAFLSTMAQEESRKQASVLSGVCAGKWKMALCWEGICLATMCVTAS